MHTVAHTVQPWKSIVVSCPAETVAALSNESSPRPDVRGDRTISEDHCTEICYDSLSKFFAFPTRCPNRSQLPFHSTSSSSSFASNIPFRKKFFSPKKFDGSFEIDRSLKVGAVFERFERRVDDDIPLTVERASNREIAIHIRNDCK